MSYIEILLFSQVIFGVDVTVLCVVSVSVVHILYRVKGLT